MTDRQSKEWQLWEKSGEYTIWRRQDGWDTIWTVTKGEKPMPYSGGYYNKQALFDLKNIKV